MSLSSGIGIGKSAAVSSEPLDPDAQIYVDALVSAGFNNTQSESLYSLSISNFNSFVNDYIIGLKDDVVWDDLVGHWLKFGGTAATNAINTKNPGTFNGSFVNGPTHGALGVTYNGTTQYMDTSVMPNVSLGVDDCHLMVYSPTEIDTGGVDIGTLSSPNIRFHLLPRSGNFLVGRAHSTTNALSVANSVSLGMAVMSRVSSTDLRGFKNGSQVGATEAAVRVGSLDTVSVYEGAANQSGIANFFVAKTIGPSSVGLGLTVTQVSNFESRLQTLLTALGVNAY